MHDPGVCAGVDEVGRGALFGPVLAAAVVLSRQASTSLEAEGLTDSKALTARRRRLLVPRITAVAEAWAIGQASARQIDREGIRAATEAAMRRALQRLAFTPSLVLVDGVLPLRGWEGEQRTIVRGDRDCAAIAAASVLAKEARDGLIQRLGQRHPGYGLERHMGYGTALHCQALLERGATDLHRQSFLVRLFSGSSTTAGNP
ncbi:ribonuclease HII [Cyanobium sp. Morenito 9A2]|uniref:ribonuclease HII n=1 Tax=Cyanobium sp. Morenito 9A2 TaxID=2823718 RepID=UPI0020CEDADD|nr:ribonuclease HII [Cyanobium sp. Morenito 9A2]MCP9850677.1 ribonuclease HII [Cyanobium sp. Morenito 9A2]